MDFSKATKKVNEIIDKIKKIKSSSESISLDNQNTSWIDNISPYRVVSHPTFFTLDKTPNVLKDTEFQTTFHIIHYPEVIYWLWLDPILKMSKNFVVSKFIYPTDATEKIHELKKKELRATELIEEQRAKGREPDKQLVRVIQESKILREALESRADSLLYMSISIRIIGSNSLEELDANTKDLLRRLDTMGNWLAIDEAAFRQIQGLQTTLPIWLNRLKSIHLFSAYAWRLTFPFYPQFNPLDEEEWFFLGMNPETKKLVFLDYRTLKYKYGIEDKNMVIIATTGWWKSTMIRNIIHRSLHLNPAYFVIDPKSDYTEHAKDWGGQVFDFSLEDWTPFNIFERPKKDNGEYIDTLEIKISSLKALLAIICNIKSWLSESSNSTEDNAKISMLDETLGFLYQKYPDGKKINMEMFDTVLNSLLDAYSKNQDKFDQEVRALKSLILSIKPYVTGSARKLFEVNKNIESRLDINNLYTVFNLQNLESADKEKSIISFMALQYSWNLIRKNVWGDRTPMIVIDEAWSLLNNPLVADYILKIFKLARGYWAWIVVATQNAEDLLETAAGVKIVNLAGINIFLKNASEASQKLREKFAFISEEIENDLPTLSAWEGYVQIKWNIFKIKQFLDESWEIRPEYEPKNRAANN